MTMPLTAERCPTCGAPVRLSVRDRHGEPAIPFIICSNEQCRSVFRAWAPDAR